NEESSRKLLLTGTPGQPVQLQPFIASGDAQAAAAIAGGGRVNRAKVESAVAPARIGAASTRVTTDVSAAGTGLCARCTVMCAATHSEQSACVAALPACVCATCTTPANTISSAQSTATAILRPLIRSGLAKRRIYPDYSRQSSACSLGPLSDLDAPSRR